MSLNPSRLDIGAQQKLDFVVVGREAVAGQQESAEVTGTGPRDYLSPGTGGS